MHHAEHQSHIPTTEQIFSYTKSKFVCAGPHSVPHITHTITIRHCRSLGWKSCHLNTVAEVQSKTDAMIIFQMNSLPPNVPEEV